MFSVELTKVPSLGSIIPVRWDLMGLMVLIFSPGSMFFLRSVFMGSEDGFPAKHQEFKVEWSAPDTEPDSIHCSSVCAEDPAHGHSPACVPAIGADKDHFEYSLCFHLCNGEKAGRGRVKEDKTLPLAVGEGPYFESARGLLGGTWGTKPG